MGIGRISIEQEVAESAEGVGSRSGFRLGSTRGFRFVEMGFAGNEGF